MKWEYLMLNDPSFAQLKAFGSEGWKLVAIEQQQDRSYRDTFYSIYVFKRPKYA